MAQATIPDGMHAHAETLYARRHLWATGTLNTTGLTFYLFTSSRLEPDGTPKLYHTIRDGSWCDCKGYAYRRQCSHSIAVKRAANEARESAARKPSILDELTSRYLDEGTRTVSAF